METTTTMRDLAETIADKRYRLAGISTDGKIEFRKVLLMDESTGANAGGFAGAEVVSTANAIINDTKIDLVIMPQSEKNNMELVSLILNSGKNLRIV